LRRMRERARMELGQPAGVTLEALVGLDAEANRLGFERERVAILMMAAQTHTRLGETRTAERLAGEAVEMAERIGDPALLGNAMSRLGNALFAGASPRAHAAHLRALELFEEIGDLRGQ